MVRLSLLISALVVFSMVLFGQTTSLTGTVTDPSGAVIPGAGISIVNTQTGAHRSATADTQGRYTMPEVAPGTYRLTAKAAGFADVVIEKVELLVNQPATVPIAFELGTTTTTVEVSAVATQLNTTDASLGNAISNNAIVQLPMFARNVVSLLQYQPGVTATGDGGERDGAVNGGRPDQSNVTLDGVDVNDQNARTAFTSVLRVTPDSIEEFKTTTTNGAANVGRGSGADVAMVTKSGTNVFHGSLYEYRRGNETAANSFFNNAAGVPKAPLLINIFGGSFGAPIKRDRLFIFFNYEGRRDASSGTADRTVATEALKQGIVTYVDKAGNEHQLNPTQVQAIDPAGIGEDQAALTALKSYPAGNDPSVGDDLDTIGYRFNAPQHNVYNTYISRLDYRIDSAGNHTLFLRGNLQNDSSNGLPQFPGLPPNSVSLNNSKGLAAGYTGIIKANLVATTRWGFTRAGTENTGVLSGNYEWFRGFTTPYGTSTGISRIVPTHTNSQDINWNKSGHDMRFGAVARLISNRSNSYAHSFSSSTSNPSWIKGTGSDFTPASLSIASGDKQTYQYAMAAVLGLESEGTADYNYNVDGTLIPMGAPVARDFVNHEGEMYAQDTWKATRNLTVTAGLRFSIEPAVYEANGQQVSPSIPFSTFLNTRETLAAEGLSQSGVGLVSFVPEDKGGRPFYSEHYNWSPRVGLAYSPHSNSGPSKFLFGGPGKTVIRAGAGMYYDEMGQPLAQTVNANAFGLATTLTTPPNVLTTSELPRYTTFYTVPAALVQAPGPSGLGAPYPSSGAGSFAITSSLDDQLKAPYTINLNFSMGREFGHGFFVQAAYVGRLSRHTLTDRDMAAYTNLKDPKSGQDFFTAMTQLATLVDYNGVAVANLPKIPFFENMWPNAAGGGYTSTQIWALDYIENQTQGDFSDVLNDFDNAANCNPTHSVLSGSTVEQVACGLYGPWMMFNPQFSALAAWSSIGKGDYHALQWNVRKQIGALTLDFNYTFSKSIDLGSARESDAGTGSANFTGNADFVQNAWNPSQMRGVSAFDTTHQANGWVVYQIPVGRGRHFGSAMSKGVDAVVGGWQISGVYRFTSGFPVSVLNGQRWPTNWEVDALATPNGQPRPAITNNANAPGPEQGVPGGPNLWSDPAAAFASYGETMAGQTGSRNTLRGSGIFNIDSGLSKTFIMPWSERQQLTFRWESYNVTNSVRFDPDSAAISMTTPSSFGKLSSQFGSPRQMQFALRLVW